MRGAGGGIRTPTAHSHQDLTLACLPVPPHPHNLVDSLVSQETRPPLAIPLPSITQAESQKQCQDVCLACPSIPWRQEACALQYILDVCARGSLMQSKSRTENGNRILDHRQLDRHGQSSVQSDLAGCGRNRTL